MEKLSGLAFSIKTNSRRKIVRCRCGATIYHIKVEQTY